MDFSSAIPTFVITLREGVEAALVVGIVLAYLKKAKQQHLNRWVYGGVLAGLGASAIVGALFGWVLQSLGNSNQKYSPVFEPLLEGVFSVMAIVMLSWMLIWMTQNARHMKQTVEGAIGSVLTTQTSAGGACFPSCSLQCCAKGLRPCCLWCPNFSRVWFRRWGQSWELGLPQ